MDGYTMKNGRYANVVEVNLNPAAAVTEDGYSAVVELGDKRSVSLLLDVTSVSASDAIDVTIETSKDGVTWQTALVTFTQATGATSEWKHFVANRIIRAKYDVTGSSVSIGFTLTGEAA